MSNCIFADIWSTWLHGVPYVILFHLFWLPFTLCLLVWASVCSILSSPCAQWASLNQNCTSSDCRSLIEIWAYLTPLECVGTNCETAISRNLETPPSCFAKSWKFSLLCSSKSGFQWFRRPNAPRIGRKFGQSSSSKWGDIVPVFFSPFYRFLEGYRGTIVYICVRTVSLKSGDLSTYTLECTECILEWGEKAPTHMWRTWLLHVLPVYLTTFTH